MRGLSLNNRGFDSRPMFFAAGRTRIRVVRAGAGAIRRMVQKAQTQPRPWTLTVETGDQRSLQRRHPILSQCLSNGEISPLLSRNPNSRANFLAVRRTRSARIRGLGPAAYQQI